MKRSKQTGVRSHLPLLVAALALAAPFAPLGGPATAALDPEVDQLISSLEGGWLGSDNDTPFGKMGFAVLFEWTDAGALHSRSPLNSETYIDLRFEKDDAGRWILHEEAAMEGLGVQSYSLVPTAARTDTGVHRWIWEQDPEFLSIDVGLLGETMSLDVVLRGRPHVSFRLDKQPVDAWAEMKREMIARGETSPEEGLSIEEVVSIPRVRVAKREAEENASTEADPIELAREAIAESPDDATTHLNLARLVSQAINQDPANGPRYAFEMLSALETAVELDPGLVEAYHYLVGYYLNAPPIAGGSIAKAEETARALVGFDPDGGERLLAQIAAHRKSGSHPRGSQ